MAATLHLPEDWVEALDRLEPFGRIAVIGPTDAGKSSFVRALIERRPQLGLVDLDPGQKMVGAPGTLSVGVAEGAGLRLHRFRFFGSTSAASIFHLTRGAAGLAASAEPFVANTSGLVKGFGARLQSATITALAADAVVALGPREPLEPILSRHAALPLFCLQPSPHARRKTAGMRAQLRQSAFAEALRGAGEIVLPLLSFEPAAPAAIGIGGHHPICALADEEEMAIAILLDAGEGRVRLFAPMPPRAPRRILLGRMWAKETDEGWKLIEPLSPAWVHKEPEG